MDLWREEDRTFVLDQNDPMKRLLFAIGAGMLATTSNAQACTAIDYDIPPGSSTWLCGDGHPDKTTIAVLNDIFFLGRAVVARISPLGQAMWTKRIDPSNPLVYLEPWTVLACNDGGALVFGQTKIWTDLAHTTYWRNYFGIRLDDQGEIVWARYFMYHDLVYYAAVEFTTLTELANGDIILGLGRTGGFSLVRLDGTGSPAWEKRYDIGTNWSQVNAVVEAPNSDWIVGGRIDGNAFLGRFDASGGVIWSKKYQAGSDMRVALTSSGDILGYGSSTTGVMRVGPDGTPQWRRTYGSNSFDHLELLASGGFVGSSLYGNFVTAASDGNAMAWWNPSWSGIMTGVV